ncbi:hypothetical protein PRK78_000796 [Emydomyces testavorans]|uniref:Uncharacterized protein n=1 Tax=Emydomyces testavorans TaxID=2070801 RepID=A0AAF0DBD6_9EURO|nr:hypothetical protein PRK78_000796 [Emydomyces testavorans]
MSPWYIARFNFKQYEKPIKKQSHGVGSSTGMIVIGPLFSWLGVAVTGIILISGTAGDTDVSDEPSVASGSVDEAVEDFEGDGTRESDEKAVRLLENEGDEVIDGEARTVDEVCIVVGSRLWGVSEPGNVIVIGWIGGGTAAEEDKRGHRLFVVVVRTGLDAGPPVPGLEKIPLLCTPINEDRLDSRVGVEVKAPLMGIIAGESGAALLLDPRTLEVTAIELPDCEAVVGEHTTRDGAPLPPESTNSIHTVILESLV